MTPHLIAIAGPSCSGKTTLAHRLGASLTPKATVLALDPYYRDLSHLTPAERDRVNFDAPQALDQQLLIEQLSALASGQTIAQPVYSFASHTRSAATETINPAPYLIVEGLFALYWAEVRNLAHTLIFVEADDPTCLQRRLQRDVHQRGRTPESVQRQFNETVAPMANRYVRPSRQHAQLELNGKAPIEQLVQSALTFIPPSH